MSPEMLATVILLACGKGDYDKHADCYENIVNCAVGPGGKIEEKKVQECIDHKGNKRDDEEVRSLPKD